MNELLQSLVTPNGNVGESFLIPASSHIQEVVFLCFLTMFSILKKNKETNVVVAACKLQYFNQPLEATK